MRNSFWSCGYVYRVGVTFFFWVWKCQRQKNLRFLCETEKIIVVTRGKKVKISKNGHLGFLLKMSKIKSQKY